jgi:hypothetical protein
MSLIGLLLIILGLVAFCVNQYERQPDEPAQTVKTPKTNDGPGRRR